MFRKRAIASVLSVIFTLTLLLTACGQKNNNDTLSPSPSQVSNEEDLNPFGKYQNPVEVTACRVLASWMGFDEGENENNNWWTKTYLEQLGVKLNVVWTAPNWGEPLDQKIATSIATDDLPDLIPVYGSLAMRLIQAGKTGDIKEVYEKYASEELKSLMERNNGIPLKNSMYDGKMFGLANPGADLDAGLVWIRKDWLEKLNLSVPTSWQEIENIASEFVAKEVGGKGTYGIAMDKDLKYVSRFANAFGAYAIGYTCWVEKDGRLEYGEIQPEVKLPLRVLADWYKRGIIAKDFATKDENNELGADIASGKVGIVFAGKHFPNSGHARALKKNNPDADWIFVPMMSYDGGNIKHYQPSKSGDFIVINGKAKHPEAIIKMVNLWTAVFGPNKPDFVVGNEYDTTKGGNMNFWNSVIVFGFGYPGKDWMSAQAVREELKNDGDGSSLKTSDKALFEQLYNWKNKGVNSENYDVNWAMDKLFGFGGSFEYVNDVLGVDLNNFYFDRFYGLDTPAMAKYGGEWATKAREYYIRAILSGKVDEEFEAWIKYFNVNGGEKATQEVNEWFNKNK